MFICCYISRKVIERGAARSLIEAREVVIAFLFEYRPWPFCRYTPTDA